MASYKFTVNGQPKEVVADPSTPLLWVLREELNMTGTKYGCGVSACGACTVHVDGVATRSCMLPIELRLGGKRRCAVRLLPERTNYERGRVVKSDGQAN